MEKKSAIRKRAAAFLMAAVLAFIGVSVPELRADAAKDYMRSLNVKFGIKEGKEYSFFVTELDGSRHDITLKLDKFKIKKAKESGYKQLTFTSVFKTDWSPTREEVLSIDRSFTQSRHTSGFSYVALVDGPPDAAIRTNTALRKVTVLRING